MSLFGDYVRNANSLAQSRLEAAEQIAQSRGSMYSAAGESDASTLISADEEEQVKTLKSFAEKYGVKTGGLKVLDILAKGARNLGPGVEKAGSLLQSAEEGAGSLAKRITSKFTPSRGAGGGDVETSANNSNVNSGPRQQAPEEEPEDEDRLFTQEEMEAAEPQEPPRSAIGDPERDLPDAPKAAPKVAPEEMLETPEGGPLGSGGEFTDQLAKQAADTGVKEAEQTAEQLGKTAAKEAEETAGTTLGEMAGEAGSALGSFLGGVLPIVGVGADLYTIITSSEDLAKGDDTFAQARQKIQQANQKVGAMEAQVSTDQFQERVGARMPSFGSLAAAGARAQQQVALHD